LSLLIDVITYFLRFFNKIINLEPGQMKLIEKSHGLRQTGHAEAIQKYCFVSSFYVADNQRFK